MNNKYINGPPKNPCTINYNNSECCICLEIIKTNLARLKCDHLFHYECIFSWYSRLVNNNNNSTEYHKCPMCNQDGGLLPIIDGQEPIENITELLPNCKAVPIKLPIIYQFRQCKALIKSKKSARYNQECGNRIPGFSNFCNIHIRGHLYM